MKKRLCISILIIFCLVFEGCFSYRDMNRLFFATMGCFDTDDEGNAIIYAELFATSRSETDKGGIESRVVMEGKGKTILEAFYDYQSTATYPVAYDVNKVLVVSERAAKHGLDDFMDSPSRNQKPTIKEFLFVSKCDPEKLLEVRLAEEQFVGIFLDNMMVFQGGMPDIIPVRINDYLNNRLMGSEINLIPLVDIDENNPHLRIHVHGAAVMRDDKMIDELSPDEVQTYKYMNGTVKVASLNVENPDDKDALVALDNLSAKTKRSVEIVDGSINVNFDINSVITFEEAQQEIKLLKKEIREEVEKKAEDLLKKKCEDLFNKYQSKGVDLFNIKTDLMRKYPNENIENYLDKTQVTVNVQIKMEGSQTTTNSYK